VISADAGTYLDYHEEDGVQVNREQSKRKKKEQKESEHAYHHMFS
jgi:hypothetical protein